MIDLVPLAVVFSVAIVAGTSYAGFRAWLDSRKRTDVHAAMDSLRAQFMELASEVRRESTEAKATVAQAVSTMNGIAVAAGLRRVPKMEQTPPIEEKAR